MKAIRGYTLLEMLVTISIIAIVAGMAVPSYRNLIDNSSLSSTANRFLGALRYARSEAVKRKGVVKICATDASGQCTGAAGNWVNGWLIYIDTNGSNLYELPGDPDNLNVDVDDILLKQLVLNEESITIKADNIEYDSLVSFQSKGQVNSPVKFAFCDERGQEYSLGLTIGMSGRAKIGERGSATCS